MASNRLDPLRRGALLLALCGPALAAAQDASELMLCGSGSQAGNGAGFVDTLPGANPAAPPGGNTSACMPVLAFDTGVAAVPSTTGGGFGPPRLGKITVVMPSGANAARISGLVGSGALVANLTLLRTRTGPAGPGINRAAEFALVLADATIDSTQTSITTSAARPTETIVLGYRRIRWQSWLDPLAGGAPSAELCYDIPTRALTC